jgi:hypothetical protein
VRTSRCIRERNSQSHADDRRQPAVRQDAAGRDRCRASGVDTFFVPKGSTFRREISLYKRRASKTKLRQNWVFGYVGRDEGTHKVPDTKRRGWVPRRVLAKL